MSQLKTGSRMCNPRGHMFYNFQSNLYLSRGIGARMPHRPRGHSWRGPSIGVHGHFNNEEHWCETCDRGFRSADLLEQHKQQHEKCNIDGCGFIAHPKVITKHIQMQHSTGLFQKIAKLKNPEDIQKWREERKKKYPTKENVAKKALEIKEKIERGEKMGLKREKRKYDRNQKQNEAPKRKFPCSNKQSDGKNNNIKKQNCNNKQKRIEVLIPAPIKKWNLTPFNGIQDLVMESDSESVEKPEQSNFVIDDDDEQELQPVMKIDECSKTEEPTVCGALSSLMCEYGSSDDEAETEALTKQNKEQTSVTTESEFSQTNSKSKQVDSQNNEIVIKPEIVESPKNLKLDKKESDDSGPEEIKVEKTAEESEYNLETDKNTATATVKKNNSNKNIQNQKTSIRRHKPKVPSTLIYKLLHNEIRQERNIVLQCIRHIVKNNYFDK